MERVTAVPLLRTLTLAGCGSSETKTVTQTETATRPAATSPGQESDFYGYLAATLGMCQNEQAGEKPKGKYRPSTAAATFAQVDPDRKLQGGKTVRGLVRETVNSLESSGCSEMASELRSSIGE